MSLFLWSECVSVGFFGGMTLADLHSKRRNRPTIVCAAKDRDDDYESAKEDERSPVGT